MGTRRGGEERVDPSGTQTFGSDVCDRVSSTFGVLLWRGTRNQDDGRLRAITDKDMQDF